MEAKTHPTDNTHIETSSSDKAMDVKELKKGDARLKDEANRKMEPEGLTVDEVANQSAYEDDAVEVAQQVVDSDRNRKE